MIQKPQPMAPATRRPATIPRLALATDLHLPAPDPDLPALDPDPLDLAPDPRRPDLDLDPTGLDRPLDLAPDPDPDMALDLTDLDPMDTATRLTCTRRTLITRIRPRPLPLR